MTTLIKKDGQYVVAPGDNLSKIASSQGITLAELLSNNPAYQKNPNLIHPGDVVKTGTSTVPSYSNLTAPVNNTVNTVNVPPVNQSTISFTDALIRMLKEAQGRNTTGQAGLMSQANKITGQGITDANRVFKNELLTPDAGTGLGRSATGSYDPSLLSIADQQKLANQGLGDITDLIKIQQDAYEKEQDRIQKAKEHAETLANKNASFDSDVQLPKFINDFESATGEDGYVAPEEWIAARTLWGLRGGSDSSFVSNFKRYLNPASYKKAGIGTITDISADWGA